MKMNLQRLEKDLEMYRNLSHINDTAYRTAIDYIHIIINKYGEEEASEILNRIAWMVRRETTTFITEQQSEEEK